MKGEAFHFGGKLLDVLRGVREVFKKMMVLKEHGGFERVWNGGRGFGMVLRGFKFQYGSSMIE